MVLKTYALISACCLIALPTVIMQPFNAQARGGGCYASKGPFLRLTGVFKYDYKRYGAVGKDWESSCTEEMPYAEVDAHALNPEGGNGSRPPVEFKVWFLGPMQSDNPKCTFEISGGKVIAIKGATRHHVDVIAAPVQSEVPWTIRFNCTSE